MGDLRSGKNWVSKGLSGLRTKSRQKLYTFQLIHFDVKLRAQATNTSAAYRRVLLRTNPALTARWYSTIECPNASVVGRRAWPELLLSNSRQAQPAQTAADRLVVFFLPRAHN
jgi:hypothetical protein